MKSFVTFVAMLLTAASALAGITYDFRSETSGIQTAAIAGVVEVEGPNLRMNVRQGDGMVFKNGSIVLSSDGGKTLMVFDPAAKTFYELPLEQVIGGMGSMMNSIPGIQVTFDHPAATVHDTADGGTIEGFRTQRQKIDASVDIRLDALGKVMNSRLVMTSETWTTDKLKGEYADIFQRGGARTGIDALDKLIAARAGAQKGRFPIKQISTVTLTQNGQEMKTTNTASVTNIVQKPIAATEFVRPTGYTKVDNPIEVMKKRISTVQ